MSAIDDFITRITSNAPSFVTVAKAWTTKPLADFTQETPAALVYLAGVQSAPSLYDTDTIQQSELTVGVLIVCEADALEANRAEIVAALVGFDLPSEAGADVVEHVSGNMQEIIGGAAWWLEQFGYMDYIREV